MQAALEVHDTIFTSTVINCGTTHARHMPSVRCAGVSLRPIRSHQLALQTAERQRALSTPPPPPLPPMLVEVAPAAAGEGMEGGGSGGASQLAAGNRCPSQRRSSIGLFKEFCRMAIATGKKAQAAEQLPSERAMSEDYLLAATPMEGSNWLKVA